MKMRYLFVVLLFVSWMAQGQRVDILSLSLGGQYRMGLKSHIDPTTNTPFRLHRAAIPTMSLRYDANKFAVSLLLGGRASTWFSPEKDLINEASSEYTPYGLDYKKYENYKQPFAAVELSVLYRFWKYRRFSSYAGVKLDYLMLGNSKKETEGKEIKNLNGWFNQEHKKMSGVSFAPMIEAKYYVSSRLSVYGNTCLHLREKPLLGMELGLRLDLLVYGKDR